MSSVSEIRDTVLSKRGRYTIIRDNLHAKEVIVGDGERRRRYILWYNPSEARRQKKHREEVVAFLEMELDKHQSRKATARWAIDLLASKRYKRYLTITKSDNIRIDRKKVKELEKYDGKWVIETNDDTIRGCSLWLQGFDGDRAVFPLNEKNSDQDVSHVPLGSPPYRGRWSEYSNPKKIQIFFGSGGSRGLS